MIVVFFYLVFCYVSSVYTAICVSRCSHNLILIVWIFLLIYFKLL